MAVLQFFKMAALGRLGFVKVRNLNFSNVRRGNVHPHAKFRAKRSLPRYDRLSF